MARLFGLVLFLLLAASPARANIYEFEGQCTDCIGLQSGTSLVTGTLVLMNDEPGQTLGPSNFVSFTYDGSNKASPFILTSPFAFSAYFDMSSGFANVAIGSNESYNATQTLFSTDLSGAFSLSFLPLLGIAGGGGGVDMGTDATWTNATATDVPEPATLALLAGAVMACVGARRRAVLPSRPGGSMLP
jgi:hypothetical protein